MRKENLTENRAFTKRSPVWIFGPAVFCLILLLSLLYARHASVKEYYYDSRSYWSLTNDIFENGIDPINILKFPESMRGYFFPSLVGMFKYIFHGVPGWRALAALCMAFCFAFSLPFALTGHGITSIRESLRTLGCYVVFMWIWGDLMQYPLSDFPSFLFIISAIAFLRLIDPGRHPLINILMGFCAGVLLYAAYNTRPTFLYGDVLVLLTYAVMNRKTKATLFAGLLGILLGMTLLALPQCYINNHNHGEFSPAVNYQLVDSEVFRGIYTARYETYIGDPELYPTPGVVFRDRTGTEIIRREKLKAETFRLPQIFELFRKYPLDMLGIYARHLISLMTPLYRQVYLTDVYAVNIPCALISFLLWLIAGFDILDRIEKKKITVTAGFVFAVCLPGLLQIFDEPELRFFLPMYLLCYYDVFVMMDYRKAAQSLKRSWPRILIAGLLIAALWFAVTKKTLVNLS